MDNDRDAWGGFSLFGNVMDGGGTLKRETFRGTFNYFLFLVFFYFCFFIFYLLFLFSLLLVVVVVLVVFIVRASGNAEKGGS